MLLGTYDTTRSFGNLGDAGMSLSTRNRCRRADLREAPSSVPRGASSSVAYKPFDQTSYLEIREGNRSKLDVAASRP